LQELEWSGVEFDLHGVASHLETLLLEWLKVERIVALAAG
jgi:hypothetical protein